MQEQTILKGLQTIKAPLCTDAHMDSAGCVSWDLSLQK